jgi:integrase
MIMMVAAFTGLRSSELRALRWSHIDFTKNELRFAERVDRYHEVGKPKSAAGDRVVPLPKFLVDELKEYRRAAATLATSDQLVFPAQKATHLSPSTLKKYCTDPAVRAAKLFKGGKPKYKGMHMFRYFYVSLLINPPSHGGLGLPVHAVQERLGHSSPSITLNRYGHLFPKPDDGGALNQIGADLFGGAQKPVTA